MSIGGIDLSGVNWVFVGLMMALSFVTALLGSLIAFRNRFVGAILAAILFGVGFVAWNYYPHNFGLPILKTTGMDGTVTPAATAPAPSTAPAPAAASPMAPTTPAPGTAH
jgi:hypothetical protein